MEKLRIVFMGTPEFAVGILDFIIKNNFKIVGVITAIDKPAGRGQKIKYSAVKEYAIKNKLPLLQPANLKDEDFLNELRKLNANLQIVVAFRMLPEIVWKMPKLGTFNLHASLLPEYRGAAPINWAIINGETRTGVTTFFIDNKIDTGAILLNSETKILPNENAGQLHDKLMILGRELVLKTLIKIEKGNVTTLLQKESNTIKTAYKLNKENCKINWSKTGEEIHNLIRGLYPYPSAWCYFKDNEKEEIIKVHQARFIQENHLYIYGKIILIKNELRVCVKNGFILIETLQFPGKTKMNINDLLNGKKISNEAIMY